MRVDGHLGLRAGPARLFLLAELDLNNPRLIESRESNGYGLAGQGRADLNHAAHANGTGRNQWRLRRFARAGAPEKALRDGFFHDGSSSGSANGTTAGRSTRTVVPPAAPAAPHRKPRPDRQPGRRRPAHRSLGYGQLALAAVLTLTSPFTPMLFMGEEFAAPPRGSSSPRTRNRSWAKRPPRAGSGSSTDGRDPAVVPDPQDPETFRSSKLDWTEPRPATTRGCWSCTGG